MKKGMFNVVIVVFNKQEEKLLLKFKNDKIFLSKLAEIVMTLLPQERIVFDYFINQEVFINQINSVEDLMLFFIYFSNKFDEFKDSFESETVEGFNQFKKPNKKEEKEKITVDIYSVKCPQCGDEFIIGELDDDGLYNFKCPHCGMKLAIQRSREKQYDFLIKESVEEKEIHLISEKEAILRNMVNPGSVIYSYDKRNWMFADSDPLFWSESTKERPLYYSTIAFE